MLISEMSGGQMAGIFFCFMLISAGGILVVDGFQPIRIYYVNYKLCVSSLRDILKGFLLIFGALLLVML